MNVSIKHFLLNYRIDKACINKGLLKKWGEQALKFIKKNFKIN